MSEILNQLNEAQRQAAACTEGPVMIIAGAGSGKTRTLTYRIAHLIEKGVDPFNILSLTFTNKAAGEMKERIIALVGSEARNIWMGTFHSVFCRILRAEASHLGYTNSFTIYDTDDSKSAVKRIVKNLNLDPKTYNDKYILGRISMAKSNLVSDADYANNAVLLQEDQSARKPYISKIYQLYNQHLRNANAMDFDDLLFNTNILLRDFPEVLLKYQNRFKYILVDEYQDTNYAQYLIVKKLAARFQNICVVGDDAQSIYAFRGANIQNILNFKRDYPSVQLFKLEQNYRSTQMIVKAANSVIARNKEQIKKEIWTSNGEGSHIKVLQATDEREEGMMIARMIQAAHTDENIPYKGFAILYRANNLTRALEEALLKASVPYRIYSGISFYGRQEVKDALAYLRLVVNNHDDEAMVRAINKPARGIGQTTLDKVRLAASDNGVSLCTVIENLAHFNLGISAGTQQKMQNFLLTIKRFTSQLHTTDAYTLARNVILASGLMAALREEGDMDNSGKIENIEELLNGIQEFCEKEDLITPDTDTDTDTPNEEAPAAIKTLDAFLQQVLLLTSEDKNKEERDEVTLMTIHSAKGLEFPFVFVAGMEENIFPSFLSIGSRQDLEEERRLFYVAVTRAEKHLVLTHAITRYQNGQTNCQELSRFVDEIDDQYLEQTASRSSFPAFGQLPRTSFNSREGVSPQFRKKQQEAQQRHLASKAQPTAQGPARTNSPAAINAIQVGQTVMHAKFGRGEVRLIEGEGDSRKAYVFFEGVGEKQLLLKFAKLTIV